MVPVNNCMSIQLNVHTFTDCTFVECNMNIPHVAVFCNQADINGPSFCCKHHSVVLADSVVKINVNAMVVDRISCTKNVGGECFVFSSFKKQ